MKTTITLLLILFTSIATFGQTTETRYYNGKYTKETALKKVNEYLKITQSDGRLKFVGGASSTYQIDGIWEQKINEKDKITVGIRYLIGDKSLSIEIISAVVAKDGNFIVLSPESTNEANRKAFDNQVNLFTKVPFDYLMINENITNPTQTTTTGSNTSRQTTETRYYNGKYTKETALNKVNEYITQLKNKGFNFTKVEGKSVYQFSGTWSLNNGANTIIEYVIGDNNLNVKLTKSTNKGMNITEIVRDEKHHLHGAVKALYDVEVLNYITKLFDYLQIKNNTTSNTSQTTTTAGSNTSKQTTETRYYNGKYTKETALKKVNEYLKITQSDGRLKFVGGASSTYQIDGIWEQKINEKDKITVGIRYLIGDKSLSIEIISAVVAKDGNFIVLSPESTNEANRKAYDNQVNLFTKVPFDYLMINENITNPTQTTTTTGSNTSFQTTETRYYNGKYTKETALQKANDFFNRTNGEKITFTKMEKKSDYQFVGNWIIKGADESLQSKIEYLFEDDGLKIKINEIVLNDKYGTLKMDKNHKDEAVRKTAENLYTSINDLYVKAVFVHLDINNNTLKNTTKTGSNTSGQSNVQNEIAEKPGASFNSSLPLYVKEVSNGVYYFYQNDKRIQDPIYHQPTSMYKNKGIKCYYRTDKDFYFYVPGTEKPNANGKYPMFGLRGKYIYTTISKEEQKFVFEGKTLKPQEYDLIVSREKNCVLLLKEKGLMFEISSIAFPKQNETVTHSASNSDALGSNSNIFIVFKENGELVVVEKGKIQSNADWKITKENDRNFLINNVDGRKYRVGIYNLAKIGVVQPHFINLLQ